MFWILNKSSEQPFVYRAKVAKGNYQLAVHRRRQFFFNADHVTIAVWFGLVLNMSFTCIRHLL